MTGGAGFIGSNLVVRLCEAGHQVRVLDDLSTGLSSNLKGLPVELVVGSVTNEALLREVSSDVDAIVHLGARGSVPRSIAEPMATHSVNATGTLNVLSAALEQGAYVIVASSSSVYGANAELPKSEEMWMQPLSPYAASKLSAEGYAMAFQAVYGLRVLVFRFFNVYGPRQRPDHDYAAVIPKFAYAALRGDRLQIHGDGKQSRDFTFVDSVTEVLVEALRRQTTHTTPVNLAFGVAHSVLDVVDELEVILETRLNLDFMDARTGDVPHSHNDPSLLTALFPDVAAVTLNDGLRRTIDWLKTTRS